MIVSEEEGEEGPYVYYSEEEDQIFTHDFLEKSFIQSCDVKVIDATTNIHKNIRRCHYIGEFYEEECCNGIL